MIYLRMLNSNYLFLHPTCFRRKIFYLNKYRVQLTCNTNHFVSCGCRSSHNELMNVKDFCFTCHLWLAYIIHLPYLSVRLWLHTYTTWTDNLLHFLSQYHGASIGKLRQIYTIGVKVKYFSFILLSFFIRLTEVGIQQWYVGVCVWIEMWVHFDIKGVKKLPIRTPRLCTKKLTHSFMGNYQSM